VAQGNLSPAFERRQMPLPTSLKLDVSSKEINIFGNSRKTVILWE